MELLLPEIQCFTILAFSFQVQIYENFSICQEVYE